MVRYLLLFLSLAGTLLNAAGADEGWSQLKPGMTPEEAAAAVGVPLLRTANRGYELWTYSNRAEVLFFHGPVIGWTAPTPNLAAARKPISGDVSLLPGAVVLRSTPVGPIAVLGSASSGQTETRFRYSPKPWRP